MDIAQIKELIRRELPAIMREDLEIRQFILQLARDRFADKGEMESRFDRILEELRLDREEQSKKWAENYEELRRLREEQNQKWEENQQVINQMLEDIQALFRKYDSGIGALGARWDLHAEESFRNALS